jgi:TrpR family trp operon transcriptional repressor
MVNKDGWRYFLTLCMGTKNEAVLTELFELLFTPEEKTGMETRCLIVKNLLDKQKNQRQISADLNVSIAKITRGSNELKKRSPELLRYLQDHLS